MSYNRHYRYIKTDLSCVQTDSYAVAAQILTIELFDRTIGIIAGKILENTGEYVS